MADNPTTTGGEEFNPQLTREEAAQRAEVINRYFVEALTRWVAESPQNGVGRDRLQMAGTGEPVADIRVEHKQLGLLTCQYTPRAALELLISSIEDGISEFATKQTTPSGVQSEIWSRWRTPDDYYRALAATTSYAFAALLEKLEVNLLRAIHQSIEEAAGESVARLQGKIAEGLRKQPGVRHIELSAHDALTERARAAAAAEYARWAKLYEKIPGMKTRPTKGRPPHRWTKRDLARAVTAALRLLPEQERSIESVYDRMKEKHATRLPKSAQALKQLLYKKGLHLQTLKDAAAKGRKSRTD